MYLNNFKILLFLYPETSRNKQKKEEWKPCEPEENLRVSLLVSLTPALSFYYQPFLISIINRLANSCQVNINNRILKLLYSSPLLSSTPAKFSFSSFQSVTFCRTPCTLIKRKGSISCPKQIRLSQRNKSPRKDAYQL